MDVYLTNLVSEMTYEDALSRIGPMTKEDLEMVANAGYVFNEKLAQAPEAAKAGLMPILVAATRVYLYAEEHFEAAKVEDERLTGVEF